MIELTFYSRQGCHLCDDMLAELKHFENELGYSLTVYNIDDDLNFKTRFNALVPIVYLDQLEVMRYHFEWASLKKALSKNNS